MNRFKGKTGIAVLAMIASFGITTFAAVPSGTVVINDKGYDLQYTEKVENQKEIAKEFIKNGNKAFLKAEDGKWTNIKTGNKVEKEEIPQLVYTNAEGKMMEYLSEDGKVFKVDVAKAAFVSANKVVIDFNKEIDGELATDKANYKIGGKELTASDKVEVSKDKKSVTITLNPQNEKENFETNIDVSENLTDKYGVKAEKEYNKNVLVVAKASTVDDFKGDVCIVAEGAEYKDCKVEGNIYINADKVNVKDIEGVNNIFINPGEKGSAYLKDLKTKGIVLLSGDTVLDSENGSFGDFDIINESQSKEQSVVELKGNFKGAINVKGNTKIVAAKGAVVENLVIDTVNKEDNVTLEGTFKNVTIKSEANIVLAENTQVKNLKSELDKEIEIEMKKGAKLEKKEGKVETKGEGKEEGDGKTVDTGNGGIWYPTPPSTPEIQKTINGLANRVKEETNKAFSDYVKIETETNKMVVKVADNLKEQKVYDVLKALRNEQGKTEFVKSIYGLIDDRYDIEAVKDGKTLRGIETIVTNITNTTNAKEALDKVNAMSYDEIVELINSVNENAMYKHIKVNGKELKEVYKVKANNEKFHLFNRNDGTPITTKEEIKAEYGINSFKEDAKVKDILGTYEVKFEGYTYTIVIQ